MREKQKVITIVFLCSPVKSQNDDFKQRWRGHPDSDVHLLRAADVKLKLKCRHVVQALANCPDLSRLTKLT